MAQFFASPQMTNFCVPPQLHHNGLANLLANLAMEGILNLLEKTASVLFNQIVNNV
jgi:hypothetical protein